jgi:hypothetical protein
MSAVQQQLVKHLSNIRYNPPPTTQAKRPRKKEKLPPGAAYTCSASGNQSDSTDEEEEVPVPVATRRARAKKAVISDMDDESSSQEEDDDDTDDTGTDDDTDNEEEERRLNVQNIVDSLNETSQEEDDELADELLATVPVPVPEPTAAGGDEQVFRPESYIACRYQDNWYVGQVMNKEIEPEAEEGDQYVLVSFMEWSGSKKTVLKWPSRLDVLNVLKVCMVPVLYHFLSIYQLRCDIVGDRGTVRYLPYGSVCKLR